ncbi:MAG: VWA domain-containing protein [Pyrinomonadaceae bacterium]|nr:VWA domain-containing protein [Pyrinomonadaceae bacterium]
MQIDSTTARLVVLPAGGLLRGRRIGISARDIASPSFGLVFAAEGQVNQRTEVVRVLPVEQVPKGALALGDDLAAKLGIGNEENVSWRLLVGGLNHVTATEICLEVQVESQLDQIVEQLDRSQDLAGQLLWIPPDAGLDSLWLEVSGTPYRVRALSPTLTPNAVLEITPSTRVTVFAPGIKTGVDIVILADCSGSMKQDDLTDMSDGLPSEGLGGGLLSRLFTTSRTISRIEALRRALNQLLDIRLRQSGRVSRIALVSFTHECNNSSVRFPRHGAGMAEVDANAPAETIRDFRDAIGLLHAEDAGTQIAPALHFAAELLHRHGRPSNDRLIVLISDGASWKPKGDAETGKEIGGLEDEVSLMDHLHRSMDINLHAIGISREDIFRPWFARKHPGQQPSIPLIPNHELLERLVDVGGGDPSRTGDTDVLQEYFSGLGTGVSRQVKAPRSAPLPSLSQVEIEALEAARTSMVRTHGIPAGVSLERSRLAEEIIESYVTVNEIALRLTGEMLFKYTRGYQLLDRSLKKEVSDPESFRHFILDAIIATLDNINKSVKQDALARSDRTEKPANYSILDVVTVFGLSEVRDLKLLRNANAHGDLNKRDELRLGEIFMQAVGVSYIEPGDSARWAQMHLLVLRKFHSLIVKFLEAYRQYEARRAAALSDESGRTGELTNAGTSEQSDAQTPQFRLVD